MDGRETKRALRAGAAGLVSGALAALGLLLATSGAAVDHSQRRTAQAEPAAFVEAAHLPPLLTLPGEVGELRYDIYCPPPGDDLDSGAPCDAGGTVFVRAGSSGPFRAVPLELDPGAAEGRYVARLPADIARSPEGFSYYAVVRDNTTGATLTVPAGGPEAPQRSLRLARPVTVPLGTHRFGSVRSADARVVQAAWGDGPDEVGLENGRGLPPIGGASFDVERSRAVSVLDEAHRRLLRWAPGARTPEPVPLAINGTLADLAIAGDGTVYVLESTSSDGGPPAVRSFSPDGRPQGVTRLADRSGSQLRIGPSGPVALQYPSGQWMPVERGGVPLPGAAQRAGGRSGRPSPGGREVVVLRQGSEVRIALVGSHGVVSSWRLTSATPLAEVQLAEPFGRGVVVVVRAYTDDRDEFLALVLGPSGLVRRFSLDSADWAETAPLARFRLVGSSLYQLGSTPAGLFVDRYDLEVSP